ncbi:MAG: chemotaxis protein CheA [Clostridia bacterium]
MPNIDPGMEIMLEAFIHETESMLEQFDEILLEAERQRNLSDENINNIFRITHTIKGSAAMMDFEGVSTLSHAVEDVFYIIRAQPEKLEMVFDSLFDLILAASDALKLELAKIQQDDEYVESDHSSITGSLHNLSKTLSGAKTAEASGPLEGEDTGPALVSGMHRIVVHFTDDCQMENMRAFMLLSNIQPLCDKLSTIPANPESDGGLCDTIIENGFIIDFLPAGSVEEIIDAVENSMNIKTYEYVEKSDDVSAPTAQAEPVATDSPSQAIVDSSPVATPPPVAKPATPPPAATTTLSAPTKQNFISVNQNKLDLLMDLVGEIVTAESMVMRNPDLNGLKLDNFTKSIRELKKLTDELQDVVMSIRMVPLSGTFIKMERIVRDMSKKLGKKAVLATEGGDTQIDKTISDSIVDPFMHMIRNSMDHGIETAEERAKTDKPAEGKITLAAKNVGGEIHIKIIDDGKGLDPNKLMEKAKNNGLLTKPENEYTEKEIYGFILLPGFSTNTVVTEYSGRGVGMDVVRKNIEQVGGTLSIDSKFGEGTTFIIKIPLTLAIAEGMNLSVGNTVFTVPITAITQSFRVSDETQLIYNSNGSAMVMIRDECYSIIKLHDTFDIETDIKEIREGILLQIEHASVKACIFADALIGEYQVVVKPFPPFFSQYALKDAGISGCSILGDGTISLILDTNALLNNI